MRGIRRGWRVARGPVLIASVMYAGALAATTALQDQPDPVRLALVVAVIVAAGWVLLLAARVEQSDWTLDDPSNLRLGRADPRTALLLSVLEAHVSAAQPDAAVRDRLRDLADRALRSRHELSVDDPRAPATLGAELTDVLRAGPRRLRPAQIERLVRRIEEL